MCPDIMSTGFSGAESGRVRIGDTVAVFAQAPSPMAACTCGVEEAGVFPDHDIYGPRTDAWSKLPDMPIPIHGVTGATFADGLIYITGGGTQVGGNSGSLLPVMTKAPQSCRQAQRSGRVRSARRSRDLALLNSIEQNIDDAEFG